MQDMKRRQFEQGSINGWMVGTIGFLVLTLIAGAVAAWMFVEYTREKTGVDAKVASAVAKGKNEQAELDQKRFSEEAKNPRVEFVGPNEFGRVSFMYPKTWSAYVDQDGTDRGDYKAYLHPGTVPPARSNTSRFAVRLEVLNSDFDKVLSQYANQLKKGELTSSSVEFNGNAATRLDGAFSKELRGSVVLMRVRDKTIRFSTDADVFKPDFQAVLDTVKFVQ
jgi:hypothetical protein cdiviTM7_01856